ncbi:MAG TPA: cupin domain-containing protein [Bacteroidales bacterium]|nr:cupin domain-containing protein [Bacteroidales bacterium]
MNKVNIQDKLDLLEGYWNPVIIGELNNQHVKLVKVKGTFPMHHHENEDEFFLVLRGSIKMDYGDRMTDVNEGEFIIVTRGTDHRPVADEDALLMLFEPAATLNTGNVRNEFTVDSPERK